MTTVAVLQSRTNSTTEDWNQVEVIRGDAAVPALHDAAKEMNAALGWPKYRSIVIELSDSEYPIEPTHPRGGKPKTGYRKRMDDGNTVSASPTWLCVWGHNVGHDLIAGPFSCPDGVREPDDLDVWYDGWVEAGKPT